MNISAANMTDLHMNSNIDLKNIKEIECLLFVIIVILVKMLFYLLFVNISRKRLLPTNNKVFRPPIERISL